MSTPRDEKSLTSKLRGDFLEKILTDVADKAIQGDLTDRDRVMMYKLALNVCAEEFYRIESNGDGGAVKPEVLLLLQQVALLVDEDVDPDKLVGGMTSGLPHSPEISCTVSGCMICDNP